MRYVAIPYLDTKQSLMKRYRDCCLEGRIVPHLGCETAGFLRGTSMPERHGSQPYLYRDGPAEAITVCILRVVNYEFSHTSMLEVTNLGIGGTLLFILG